MLVGCARCSTEAQDLTVQRDAADRARGEAEPDLLRSRLDRYAVGRSPEASWRRTWCSWTVRAARRDGAAQQSVTYVDAMLIEGFSY